MMKSIKLTLIAAVLVFCILLTTGANKADEVSERAKVYDSPQKVSPVLVGTIIPDVALQDVNDNTIQLTERISQKPTVLIFYRGGLRLLQQTTRTTD